MGRQPEARVIRKHGFIRYAFRFFTGRPLDGIRRTDAIFHKRGRTSMDPSGYATAWSLLAGYQRLLVRLFGLYLVAWGFVLLAAGALRYVAGSGAPQWAQTWTPGHAVTVHVLGLVLIGGPPFAVWGVRYWGLSFRVPALSVERDPLRVVLDGWVPVEVHGRRTWERRYVRPVAAAAQAVLGTSRHPKEARKWVQVPRTFRAMDGSPVVLALPQGFTADLGTQKRLITAVSSRLGMRSPSVTWDLEGDRPRVLISAPPAPPSHVTFAEVREALEAMTEYQVFLGLAARREWLSAHLAGDSPHIAVSAGSGAGKSEMIKVLVMLALRWGWGVIILDWKEVSHEWAEGLPGVRIVTDVEAIHDTCVSLGHEVDSRKKLHKKDKTMPGKAKVLVVAEEMNQTAPLLKGYWDNLRSTAEPDEKRTMPVRSPAMEGLSAVNFGGRQFGMFLVFVAQRFSARVTNGNADLRESFQIRLMCRTSIQTIKMLAGHVKPLPVVSGTPGRFTAVIGQEVVEYQAPLITDEEAREFALGGKENPSHPLTSNHRPAMPNQTYMDVEQGDQLGDRLALPSQRHPVLEGEVVEEMRAPDLRKLSAMVEGLTHLGITLNVLQHAAKDPDSGFPPVMGGSPNRGYTYDYSAVTEWARKRQASRVAKGEVGK